MAAAKKKPQRATSAPDDKAWVEPSVRTFTTWTTALIQQAEISADSGNLRLAANLCEWILSDDRVAATLNTRTNALFGLEPTFEASGDKRRSNRAVKALDAGEDWWEAYPETESAQILRWGLLLGVAPGHQLWGTVDGHGGRWLPMPEFWHPQHLRQDQGSKQWFIRVATQGNAHGSALEVPLEAGDGEWILHTPYGRNRPWSLGLWRSLARLVLLKHLARQDWSRVGEKGAILVLNSEGQKNADREVSNTKDARRQLAEDIYNRGRHAVAALPPGTKLELVETEANTKELYDAQISMADTAIAILIRGGNLGTEVQEGSRAAAETQAKSGDLGNLRFDAQSWTTTVHDQSLVWWAEFNYGDRNLAPWPVYPVEPEEDRSKKGETEEKALANLDAAERLGLEVDRQAFLDEYEITWAKPGERPPDPVPVAPAAPGEQDPAAPEPEPEPEPEDDEDEPKPQARAMQARAATVDGFDNGNRYSDRLFKKAAAVGAKELAPTLAAVIAEVRKAKSYDEAREAIEKRFAKMLPPTELASLLDASLTMGQLAGHLSVREDVPELEE